MRANKFANLLEDVGIYRRSKRSLPARVIDVAEGIRDGGINLTIKSQGPG